MVHGARLPLKSGWASQLANTRLPWTPTHAAGVHSYLQTVNPSAEQIRHIANIAAGHDAILHQISTSLVTPTL